MKTLLSLLGLFAACAAIIFWLPPLTAGAVVVVCLLVGFAAIFP